MAKKSIPPKKTISIKELFLELSERKRRLRIPKIKYTEVVRNLRKILKTTVVTEEQAIWRAGQASKNHLPEAHFKVAVWNLFKGAGGEQFTQDFRHLLGSVDLLLTQEALVSVRSLQSYLIDGVEGIHAASYERTDALREGVMTLSKVAAAEQCQRILCFSPEPVVKTPKAALVSFYPIGIELQQLMVINIHAILFRTVKGFIKEIDHIVSQIPDHKGPVLFAGDFNTFTPRYLKTVIKVMNEIGLDYIPIENEQRPSVAALDQVFVRGLIVKKAELLYHFSSSDHFPIVLHFSLDI